MQRRAAFAFAMRVTASLTTRARYFLQLCDTPFVHLEQWAQTDMHDDDGWARQILNP